MLNEACKMEKQETQKLSNTKSKLSFLEELFLCDECKNKALAWGTRYTDKFGKDCCYYHNCVDAKLQDSKKYV